VLRVRLLAGRREDVCVDRCMMGWGLKGVFGSFSAAGLGFGTGDTKLVGAELKERLRRVIGSTGGGA